MGCEVGCCGYYDRSISRSKELCISRNFTKASMRDIRRVKGDECCIPQSDAMVVHHFEFEPRCEEIEDANQLIYLSGTRAYCDFHCPNMPCVPACPITAGCQTIRIFSEGMLQEIEDGKS